jgi:hypothetical protein
MKLNAENLKITIIVLVVMALILGAWGVFEGVQTALAGQNVPLRTGENFYMDVDRDGVPDYVRSIQFVPSSQPAGEPEEVNGPEVAVPAPLGQ